jgi:hypothetical protein
MGVGDWHEHGTRSLGLLVGEWLILLHAGTPRRARCRRAARSRRRIDSTRDDGTPASTRPLPGGTTITVPTGLAPAPAPRRPAGAVAPSAPPVHTPPRPCTPAARRAHVHATHVHERRARCARPDASCTAAARATAGLGRRPVSFRPCRATTSAAASAPPPSRIEPPMAAAGDPAAAARARGHRKLLSTVALGGRAGRRAARCPPRPRGRLLRRRLLR